MQDRQAIIENLIQADLMNENGHVDLSNIRLSLNDMRIVLNALSHLPQVRSINLHNCSLNELSAKPLIALLKLNKSITDVNYSGNPIIGFENEFDIVTLQQSNKDYLAQQASSERPELFSLFGLFHSSNTTSKTSTPTTTPTIDRHKLA